MLKKLNYKGLLLSSNDINISSERHSIFADSDMIFRNRYGKKWF